MPTYSVKTNHIVNAHLFGEKLLYGECLPFRREALIWQMPAYSVKSPHMVNAYLFSKNTLSNKFPLIRRNPLCCGRLTNLVNAHVLGETPPRRAPSLLRRSPLKELPFHCPTMMVIARQMPKST